jgi:hypothetical protein
MPPHWRPLIEIEVKGVHRAHREEAGQGSFHGRVKATAGSFEGDGCDFAGVDVGHAGLDFFVPGGFDGGIVGFVEAFDEGAGEVSAFRDGERKSFFQKLGGFLGHTLIITRNMVIKTGPAGLCE